MDEIKRKLTQIEAQLSGRRLPARLMATAPLLFLALALMIGIIAQEAVSTRFGGTSGRISLVFWALLVGAGTTGVCSYFVAARRDPQPLLLAAGATLCFTGLGATRLIVFERPAHDDIRHLVGNERTLATIRGHLLTRPQSQRQDWCFARLSFSDPTSSFYLSIRQVKTERGWSDVAGTLRVQVNEPTPNLRIGDCVQLYCWLYRFEPPTNPGQFDLAAHLRRRGIYLGASVPSRAAIEVQQDAPPPNLLDRLRGRLSEAAARALLDDGTTTDPHGLLEALLLGNRGNIDRDTYEAFRRTGLLHMISLSGLHLGIFVGLIWRLGRRLGLLKPKRALVCAVATAVFVLVVPPRAPTVRAAIIVWTFCAAILLRRHTNPLNTLCLAAIVLLLIRPTQLFEVGWQLSFASVAGILAFTDPVELFIHDRADRRFGSQKDSAGHLGKLLRKAGRLGSPMFSVGIAAWLGGAGVLLYHFYTITPLTSLWTVLVFPLLVLVLTLGVLKIALFFLLPTLSYILGLLAGFSVKLLIGLVKILALPRVNCILIGHVALWLIVLYYGLVLLARFGPARHARIKRGLCVAMALILVTHLVTLKWQRTHRDHLRMTCLDVGHGQAIVVQFPGTKNVLFDAGSMYCHDVGTRIVLPFLDYMGVARLHAIVISHGDVDHINGIPEIVDRRRVEHVYANDTFFPQAEPSGPSALLIESLTRNKHTVERMPERLPFDGATVDTLWPLGHCTGDRQLSDNDRSLVARIEYAGVTVLLCSDIEAFAQRRIMALYPDLAARIVVVPHHGSKATRHEVFLPKLQPDVLIVSCGRRSLGAGQPSHDSFQPEYFFTAKNGAITVCVQSEGVVETAPYICGAEGE